MYNIFRKKYDKEWKNDIYTVWLLTKPHIGRLCIAIVCSFLLSSINGLIAYLVKPSLDNLFIEKNKGYVYLLPIGMFFLFLFRGIFSFCNNFLMNSVGAKIVRSLRQGVYEKLLNLPISFYQDKSSGSIISRLLNDIGSLENSITYTAKNFFVQLLTVLLLAGVAFYRKWDLALLSFLVIPAVVIVSDKFGKKMRKTSTKTRKLISDVTKVIQESIMGIKVIKTFLMHQHMQNKNEKAVAEHYRNVMREVRINEFTTVFMEIIAGSAIAIILYYGSYLILKGDLSIGDFFSFVTAVLMLYTPLKRLSKINNNFQTIRTALNRIREIFQIEDEKNGTLFKEIIGNIIIKNLTFKYPSSVTPVLKNINLEINPGDKIAIIGYSGAGKSTLVEILLGLWHEYKGKIFIDGIELREYDIKCLRSQIAVVSQDIVLFDDTVKNNILFGKTDATDEEIIKAAKAAYADEFIIQMPNGYDTKIGEKGVKLSGGQKQRIALARAILKNPKILILDEATSSLDADSETKIQKALASIITNKTIIIITHKLSSIKKVDKIIIMDKGKIIQQGNHYELYDKAGVYQYLYNIQLAEEYKK